MKKLITYIEDDFILGNMTKDNTSYTTLQEFIQNISFISFCFIFTDYRIFIFNKFNSSSEKKLKNRRNSRI